MLKKTVLILGVLSLMILAINANADDKSDSLKYFKGWKSSLMVDLTVTQATYSDSWTGGEAGSFTWVSNANGVFTRWFAEWLRMKNNVKLSFGQTATQDQETKDWSKPEKSSDKIDLESIGLINIEAWVEPFLAGRFQSQFLDASDEGHKKYIDPIELTLSGGIAKEFNFTTKDNILTRLGLAVKHNRNRFYDDVSSTEKTKTDTDGGLESNTDINMELGDNLDYIGKLTVYKALAISNKDQQPNDYWKTIDVNWENAITATVSKYVKVSLYIQLLYDKQISKKGRLKQTLSLGISYKLM